MKMEYDVAIMDTAPAFNSYTASAIFTGNVYFSNAKRTEWNKVNNNWVYWRTKKDNIKIILAKTENTALSNITSE